MPRTANAPMSERMKSGVIHQPIAPKFSSSTCDWPFWCATLAGQRGSIVRLPCEYWSNTTSVPGTCAHWLSLRMSPLTSSWPAGPNSSCSGLEM